MSKRNFASETLASRNEDCVKVHNVVATFSLGHTLPIVVLALASGGQADPDVFPDAVSRSMDTGTVNSVFQTGQVVLVGGKSEDEALFSAHLIKEYVWDTTGIPCDVTNFRVCNIVCRVELPYSIPPPAKPKDPMPPTGGVNMLLLKTDCTDDPRTAVKKGVSFQPTKFPGLKWKMQLINGHAVTFALFERGRGVVTGLLNLHEVYLCNSVVRELPSYERGNEYRDLTALEMQAMQDAGVVAMAELNAARANNPASKCKRARTLKESKSKKQRILA